MRFATALLSLVGALVLAGVGGSEESSVAGSAVEVAGDGAAFSGSVGSDVRRLTAVRVDGVEEDLPLGGDGEFTYHAALPDETARLLIARDASGGVIATTALSAPVPTCGGATGPCAADARTPAAPTYAFIGELPTGGTSLVRVDPRTLTPIGDRLSLREPFIPSYARSPDGTKVALGVRERPLIRIVDLERLKVLRTLRLGEAGTEARTLAWLADDRLLVVAQRMSRPTRRYVRERAVVTLNPTNGRVIARRQVTNKLAVGGIGSGAGRLVVLLRPSGPDGSAVQLVVADTDGDVRTRVIDVGRRRGVLNTVGLTVDPTGRRAFLLGWAIGRQTPPVTEVDLETMSVSVRTLRVERSGPLPAAAVSGLYVGAVDEQHIAAVGAIASTERRDKRILPAAGVFLIDTKSWTARLADPGATYFQAHDGRVITYGISSRLESVRRTIGRGSGISEYEKTGRRLYHLYANRPFSQVVLAGDYGHVLLGPPRTKRLVFDALGGRPLGMLPALRRPIEILPPPPPRPAGTRTTSSLDTIAPVGERPLFALLTPSGAWQSQRPVRSELPTLTRLDPRTFAPTGRRLRLSARLSIAGRSSDGRFLALFDYRSGPVRIVDLDRMRVHADIALGLGEKWRTRAAAWLTTDRLVHVVQRMRGAYNQIVDRRELILVDAFARRVVVRRPLRERQGLLASASAGGKLVLLFGRADRRSGVMRVAVVDRSANVHAASFELRSASVRRVSSLVVEPSGRHAFVVTAGAPIAEIDLETMQVALHRVEGERPIPAGASFATRQAVWVDERTLAVAGSNISRVGGVETSEPAGLALIDTTKWRAREIDAQASAVAASSGILLAHGGRVEPARGGGRAQQRFAGIGIRAYGKDGIRRWQRFDGQAVAAYPFRRFVQVTTHPDPPTMDRPPLSFVLDLDSGRQLARIGGAGTHISLVSEPPGSPPTRRPSGAGSSDQDDSFSRVSNKGTRVEPKAEKGGEREHTPRDLFLLRQAEGRAVYLIGGLRRGYTACYASGFAKDIGRLGSLSCGRSRFPSRQLPVFVMSAIQMRRGDKTPHLFRLEGVAADGVAEIGLLDADNNVIDRVRVEANVFVMAKPPAEATGGIVAFDHDGNAVYRTDARGRPPSTRPSRPANPRRLAGYRVALTLPNGWTGQIRRSSAGPFRALVVARSTEPVASGRWASFVLAERDPRSGPPFPAVAAPPRLFTTDVRPRVGGRAGASRRFSYKGRQFSLRADFGTRRPRAAAIRRVNAILATLEVGAIAVPAATVRTGRPLQRGESDGVSVDVYRSGIVVFRFAPAGRLNRLLRGREVSFSCLTFDSVSPWETNGWGTSKRFAPVVQATINEGPRHELPFATLDPQTGAQPPFDGCLISGSYGRRWNDPRGQHSPAEVAFTARGRRFFDERAVARDLALFIRSPVLSRVRRAMKQEQAAPAAEAIAPRLPARVVALDDRSAAPARGRIGVWTDRGERLRVSQRTAAGKRLFIEVRRGRIADHNLEGLAFVF